MLKALALLALLTVAPLAASGQTEKSPALELNDLRGRRRRLSDYRGKVVLLNFWATWCPPCRAEVPDLVRWQREYAKDGLQVVGVTYPPTDLAGVRRFVRRHRVSYPVLLGSKETKALFMEGETLPVTVVIDREGNVRERIEGILLPEEFEEKVKPLLRRRPARAASRLTLRHTAAASGQLMIGHLALCRPTTSPGSPSFAHAVRGRGRSRRG